MHGNPFSRPQPAFRWVMKTIVGLVVLLSAAQAHASTSPEPLLPPPETGLVSLLAGVRYVPQGALIGAASKAGWTLSERLPVSPAIAVPFSYRLDSDWSVGIEFGWSPDSYVFREASSGALGSFSAQTFGLLVAGQWHLNMGWERVEPYLGGGIGYYLTSVATTGGMGELPRAFEAHAGGAYLAAGARVGIGLGWALLIEERYAFATAGLADFGAVTVGGNTVSLGISRVWR